LILPAIGVFTGSSTIRPSQDDGVWVVADGNVLADPNLGSQKSNRSSA
jgi:hypothetical protein